MLVMQRSERRHRAPGTLLHPGLTCLLLMVALCIAYPLQAHAAGGDTELNNQTGPQLGDSSYVLTEDINGRSYEITGKEVHIKLNGHTFKGGSNKNTLMLFTVGSGNKLVIEGNGKTNAGIEGYDVAFNMLDNTALELRNLQVSKANYRAVGIEGSNVTIKLDNTKISETKCTEYGGAIRTYGNCNGLTISGTLTEKGKPTSEISDTNQKKTKSSGVVWLSGNNSTVENLLLYSNHSSLDGGGVSIWGDNSKVCKCAFTRNTSKENGGAVSLKGNGCAIEECSFNKNQADLSGGAVYMDGNKNSVKDCSFDENSAYEYGFFSDSGVNGGAVYIKGNEAQVTGITAENSTAKKNGGTICIEGDGAVISNGKIKNGVSYDTGGAISIKGHGATIKELFVDKCSAKSIGGGIEVQGNDTMMSEIKVHQCVSQGYNGGISLKGLDNSIGNADIDLCSSSKDGGAIGIYGGSGKLDGSLITRCHAKKGFGGAVYLEGSEHVISNDRFYKNQSVGNQGGAVYTAANDVKVVDCVFQANIAGKLSEYTNAFPYLYNDEYRDGGYTLNNYDFKSRVTWLSDDDARLQDGGALCSSAKNTKVRNSTFLDNMGKNGGALFFKNAYAQVLQSTFRRNIAHYRGGGIYFESTDTKTDDCGLYSNRACRGAGGAICYKGENNTLIGSEEGTNIEGNVTREDKNFGHGVFVDNTDLAVGGKLIIRNNNNIDLNKAEIITEGVDSWSNLCMYGKAGLEVAKIGDKKGLSDGSEVWLDTESGRFQHPAGLLIWRLRDVPKMKAKGFHSDRRGYHFVEYYNSLRYARGTEELAIGELPAPTVSLKPTGEVWTENPGRVYVDFDPIYEGVGITEKFTFQRKVNDEAWRYVKSSRTADGRRYIDMTGEAGEMVTYRLELAYTVTMSSPSGGKTNKKSASTIAEYKIKTPSPSKVSLYCDYEGGVEPVREDLGTGKDGKPFEYSGVEHPILKTGHILDGWKLHVDGEDTDRDIEVEWNEAQRSIKCTLPDDLSGRDVLLIPQQTPKKYKVTYQATPSDAEIDLPEDSTVVHGSKLTIEPIGKKNDIHSIGSYVNEEETWGRKPYTVDVTGDILVRYVLVESEVVTVTYDDPKAFLTGSEEYDTGNSYWDQKQSTTHGIYELKELQVGVPDEGGKMTFSDDRTISIYDPITENMTLRPVWHYTVPVMINSNYCTVTAPRSDKGYGYYTDGDLAQINYEPSVTTGQVPCGWKIDRFETSASNPFGTIYPLSEDEIRTSEEAAIMEGLGACEADAEGISFDITEEMGAPTQDGRRVFISVEPILIDPVTGISGVPETLDLNKGEVFDLSEAVVLPQINNGREISWVLWDGMTRQPLTKSFIPTRSGSFALMATVKDGLGLGEDYDHTFWIDVTQEHTHTLQAVPASKASCTESGNEEYWYCTECGEYFADAVGTEKLGQSDTIIQPLGHDWLAGEEMENDGECGGIVVCYTCSQCGEERMVAKEGTGTHSSSAEPRQEIFASPTCEKTGKAENIWTCESCDMITKTERTEIPPLGHDWGEPEYKIIGELDQIEATRVCKNDPGHEEKEVADVTAEKKGDLIYYSAKFENAAFAWSFEDDGQRGGASEDYAKKHIVKAHDGSWVGEGASIKAANYALTKWKKNSSPKGTAKSPLKLKATKKTKTSVKLKWSKVKTTKKYVIYGGKKGQALKKIATTSKRSYTVKKIGKKKLTKNTSYRFIIVALDRYNFVNSTSKLVKAKTRK